MAIGEEQFIVVFSMFVILSLKQYEFIMSKSGCRILQYFLNFLKEVVYKGYNLNNMASSGCKHFTNNRYIYNKKYCGRNCSRNYFYELEKKDTFNIFTYLHVV